MEFKFIQNVQLNRGLQNCQRNSCCDEIPASIFKLNVQSNNACEGTHSTFMLRKLQPNIGVFYAMLQLDQIIRNRKTAV